MLQKIKNLSATIKVLILILIAGLVVCGVVLYMQKNPPRDIRSLGEVEPKCIQDMANTDTLRLKWGAVEVEITDPAQITDIAETLESLQVTEYIREIDYHGQWYNDYGTCHIIGSGSGWMYFSDKLQRLDGYETEWLVTTPEILGELFQKYCMKSRDALADTTFYVDLSNNHEDEIIVVNPMNDSVHFSVYDADGYALYDVKKKVNKYNAHGDHFLYEKDGKHYLLETDLDDMRSLDVNFWRLLQFDDRGDLVYVESNLISIEPENGPDYEHSWYDFDLQALYPALNELDAMLQDAVLLFSTDGEAVQYSTITHTEKRNVNDYMNKWYDAMPVLHQTSRDAWMAMNMDERLTLCDKLLRIDSQYMYAKGWAESYVNNDGEARHQLMTDDLWKATTKVNQTEERESWMPILEGLTIHREEDNNNLYSGNDSEFHYALKDDDLTVKDYSVEQATDENGAIVENTFRILYEIAEDSGKQYTYIEQIVFERGENWPDWLVTECESLFC